MVKKRAKSVVCAAVFFLMAVPSPVWAGEEESLQVENRIVLDKVEIVLEEFQENEAGERSPWETPECSYPGEEISKIPVIENQGVPCYLRVRVDFQESEELPNLWNEDCLIGVDEEKWCPVREDGALFYYLREPLASGAKTELFYAVKLPEAWGNETAGTSFGLKLSPEAVQADHFVQDLEQEHPWGDVIIEDYEKKNQEQGYQGGEGPFQIGCSPLAMKLIASPDGLFFLNFNGKLPGDLLTGETELFNRWEEPVELFLRIENGENKTEEAEILLKEIQVKLTLKEEGGEAKILYQGPLGPEGGEAEMSLGRFPPGYEGKLCVEAEIPSELDNAFTLTDVITRWSFRTAGEEPVTWIPATGDSSDLYGWLAAGTLAVGAAAGLVWHGRKQRW